MNKPDTREQFEKWARDNCPKMPLYRRDDGRYSWIHAAWALEAWQARDAEIERLKEALHDALDLLSKYRGWPYGVTQEQHRIGFEASMREVLTAEALADKE